MNPQAQPRLKRSETNEKVACGFIDPCLVFLEAHDQGFPVFVVCWANSSQDIKKPGEPALFVLSHVLLFGWYPNTGKSTPWLFKTGELDSLRITGNCKEMEKTSAFDSLGLATHFFSRIHVKYLTQEETEACSAEKKISRVALAGLILKLGSLDWPSISAASRSLNDQTERRHLSPDRLKELASSEMRRVAPKRVTPRMPFLEVILGTEIKTYPIRPWITTYIGQSIENDIVIADPTISPRHASLEYSPKGILLKDLGSNCTFVASEAITERWLGTKERLKFGGVYCFFTGLR